MAKLIGHYYDGNGKYNVFIIEGLRETHNLYLKTDQTSGGAPNQSDNWDALNKCHLGKLRPHASGIFTMYCLSENLSRFKDKVTAINIKRMKIKKETFSSFV
jgi:hypothetical protein